MQERVTAWRAAGFVRLLVDGKEQRLDAGLPDWSDVESVDLVVDRLGFDSAARPRIAGGRSGRRFIARLRQPGSRPRCTGRGHS